MPESDEYVRVTEVDTGTKRSVRQSVVDNNEKAYRVLSADAVNLAGDPLPPEFASPKKPSATPNGADNTKGN